MRLKSLEIKGFKSFADKTTINFDEGITGIIGPNGCGKSNIVDSIRWVIGEHKISNLRSENLESLVFKPELLPLFLDFLETIIAVRHGKDTTPPLGLRDSNEGRIVA